LLVKVSVISKRRLITIPKVTPPVSVQHIDATAEFVLANRENQLAQKRLVEKR